MKKEKLCLAGLLIFMLVFTATSLTMAKDVIKIGLTVPADHPYALGLQYYFKELNKKTDNRFELKLFPNNQLGGERELVESVQLGALKMSLTSAGPLSAFAPSIKVFDLPFLFKDSEHAYRVFDGHIGQKVLEEFSNKNLIGLAFWESGWRNLTNSRHPIYSPKDLNGLKIRVMESPVMISTLNAMGAQATPMAWPEVLTALQQKVIDGQENPLVVIWGQGVYDVQKYLSLTGHFYTPAVLLINATYYHSLPEDIQLIIKEVAIEAAKYQRSLCQKINEDNLQKIKDAGMIVTDRTKIDFKAFNNAVTPVYEKFADEVGGMEFINQIKNY